MNPAQWSALEPKIRKWAFQPWWRYYPICGLGLVLLARDQTRWAFICFGIFFTAFSLLLVFAGVGLIYRLDKKRGYAMIALGFIATAFSVKIGLSR
jgi:hypothetical protein